MKASDFINNEFAKSSKFSAVCRDIEDFAVEVVNSFLEIPDNAELPWTFCLSGSSRDKSFVQLPTKFVDDVVFAAFVGAGFPEDINEWSMESDDILKGARVRVGSKVQSSLAKRRSAKSAKLGIKRARPDEVVEGENASPPENRGENTPENSI
uniref:Uncharacterized protein n=1 Tax=Panagrolaimus superbus TaxID=310955 RepID=A0A914YMU7_9BILA